MQAAELRSLRNDHPARSARNPIRGVPALDPARPRAAAASTAHAMRSCLSAMLRTSFTGPSGALAHPGTLVDLAPADRHSIAPA